MGDSTGIHFQTSIINTEESKALTMSNQPGKKQQKRCRYGSIKHLRVTSKDFPVGLAIRNTKKLALGMGISQSEAKEAAEDAAADAAAEEDIKYLAAEAAGEGEKSDEGGHQQ